MPQAVKLSASESICPRSSAPMSLPDSDTRPTEWPTNAFGKHAHTFCMPRLMSPVLTDLLSMLEVDGRFRPPRTSRRSREEERKNRPNVSFIKEKSQHCQPGARAGRMAGREVRSNHG